jgi:glycerophosphoryl diester phosphodiesterase
MKAPFPFHKPLVLGHRGDSAHAPENTLSSFRLAMQNGADGIELDARMVRGGEVMVLHDGRLERTTNGTGRLADRTVEEVQRLEIKGKLAGERIPTLAQVFEALGDDPIYDLELKNIDAPGNGLEEHVAELVQRYHLEQRVLVSSFNPWAVRKFCQLLPQVPGGMLLLNGAAGRLEERLFGGWPSLGCFGLWHGGLDAGFAARQARQPARSGGAGREILVWGASTRGEVRRALQLGAVGMVVDDPAMARAEIEAV